MKQPHAARMGLLWIAAAIAFTLTYVIVAWQPSVDRIWKSAREEERAAQEAEAERNVAATRQSPKEAQPALVKTTCSDFVASVRPVSEPRWNVYNNSEHCYSLEYPENWTYEETYSNGQSQTTLFPVSKATLRASGELSPWEDIEVSFVSRSTFAQNDAGADFRSLVLSLPELKSSQGKVRWHQWSIEPPGLIQTAWFYVLVGPDRSELLQFSASVPANEDEQVTDLINRIVGSVRVF